MRTLLLATMTTLMIGCGSGGGGGGIRTPLLDGGTKTDMAMTIQMPDLAMQQQAKPDLAMAGNKTGCNGALGCINACMDPNTVQQCITACRNGATPAGWNKLVGLIQCIFGSQSQGIAGACPDFGGGVCDSAAGNYNPTNCDNCVSKSQMQGGACYAALMACLNDMP